MDSVNKLDKRKALHDISIAISALKNPQCHYDLFMEDPLLLKVKLEELEKEFELMRRINSD